MLYLGLTVCVCFKHRLKCFLFFTYFKNRYKVTKLWLKITICSHPKCTKLDFFRNSIKMLHQKAPKANSIEDTKMCQKENGRDVIHHVRL